MMDCLLPGHGYSLTKGIKMGEKDVTSILRTPDGSFEVVCGKVSFIVEPAAVAYWERA